MRNWQSRVRDLLRATPDGMTIKQLVATLAAPDRYSMRDILLRMPDTYIDRWVKEPGTRGRYAAVWCVVVPPPNCPPPEKQ